MARNDRQKRTTDTEDRIALVLDADEAFTHIGVRTSDPHITNEIAQGRSALRRLWSSLVGERQALQKEDSNDSNSTPY